MKVIGYVFDQSHGKYLYKYYFKGTIENIVRFILQNRTKCKKITITDICDCLICTYDDGIYFFGIENEEATIIIKLVSTTIEYTPIKFKLIEGNMEQVSL